MPQDAPSRSLRSGRPPPSNLPAATAGDPHGYKEATRYSDSWEAHREVIPKEQHKATAKEEGETSHVERRISALRRRLSRFVRKTLSFSKSRQMHRCCLKLFICRYNLERRSIILK